MYTTISFDDFANAFERMGRADQFSHAGLRALFDYLEQSEEDLDMPLELDVIALCCEYIEVEADELDEAGEVIAELPNGSFLCAAY